MAIPLFEHNERAYLAAMDMLQEKGRAAVIHPTGTGKSFIAFRCCEEMSSQKICWLSPSRYIFETQLENVREADPSYDASNITFYTYAKLALMTEEELLAIVPDCIVLDEFHRCGAQMWGQGVERLRMLFPKAMLLGLSATAVRYLDHQRNMAGELFDSNIASEMTLGEAITRGILQPPTYVTALYAAQKSLLQIENRVRNTSNPMVRADAEKLLEALRRSLEKADGLDTVFHKHLPDKAGKYIVFCVNAGHMREIIAKVPEWFAKIDRAPHCYAAYSEDPETSEAIRAFKADTDAAHLKLLFCIDMLNEGVHIDRVDGVILFRPTVSPIVFKQQIGRALCAGKKRGTVILDIVNNIENLYSIAEVREEMEQALLFYRYLGEESFVVNETFSVIDTVRDCRLLFEQLETVLSLSWDYCYREAEAYYAKHGSLFPLQSYRTESGLNLGQWIVAQRTAHARGRLTAEQTVMLEAIGMNWLGLRERQWEEGYSLATEYFRRNGSLSGVGANTRLGRWLYAQRQKYHRGTLPQEQFKRLDALRMVWEQPDIWEKRLCEAKKYKEIHGDLDIPVGYISESGVRLGLWYRSVRNRYHENRLPAEKSRQLEALGADWTSVQYRTWMQQYELAVTYYKENGNLIVPKDYSAKNGMRLGLWIAAQRVAYAKGTLSSEKIEMLNEIGMSWQRDTGRWETGFQYAQEYSVQNGNANAPAEYIAPDGFALGTWIARQRRKYKEEKLKPEQIHRLEALGILWDPAEAFWQSGYEHACDYYREHGDLAVPGKYIADDGFRLGSWLANQKTRWRKGELRTGQEEKLREIGFRPEKKAGKTTSAGNIVVTA